MKVKRNIARNEKYRQYLTTYNRMQHIAAMSEKQRGAIEAIDEAAREALKE